MGFLFGICCVEEEPYLIFANRYYLRKLNLDGSNYTLIKQVSVFGSLFRLVSHNAKFLDAPVQTAPVFASGS